MGWREQSVKDIVYIRSKGDRSVGINPQYITIDGVFVDKNDKDDIDFVRKALVSCFSDIFDEPAYVMFQFEHDEEERNACNEGKEP